MSKGFLATMEADSEFVIFGGTEGIDSYADNEASRDAYEYINEEALWEAHIDAISYEPGIPDFAR